MPSMRDVASSSVWAEPVERLERHRAAAVALHARVKQAFRHLRALASPNAGEEIGH
jgi:hypothetical protein